MHTSHRHTYIYICTSYRKIAYNNHHSQITHFLSYPQSPPTAPRLAPWQEDQGVLSTKSPATPIQILKRNPEIPGDSCGDSCGENWLNLKRYLPGIELCWGSVVYQGTAKQSQSWDSVGQPSFHGMHSSSRQDFFFWSRGESEPWH